jgi:tRNA-dihydrouridine synthase B
MFWQKIWSKMYSVGKLNLMHGIFLAPMEDVSDMPFRIICRELGADMVFTEFVSSEALRRNVDRSLFKIQFSEKERPIGIQIFGNNAESLAIAAQIAADHNPDVIDINWGCPVKKVAYKGGGSGALRDPDGMLRMTDAVIKAVDLPVTVKTRTGYDQTDISIVRLAPRLEDIGVAAITVHGRTRSQMYKGTADWDVIGEVKSRVNIPVIGNGDLQTAADVNRAFTDYGVDAVMIGRAAIGNPWLFREAKAHMAGEEMPDLPSINDKIDLLIRHLHMSYQRKGDERRAMLEMRRQITAYLKGIPGVASLRKELMELMEVAKIEAKLREFAMQNALV